ncbi:MAG: 23S rRNA (uracil(1939)-C(5))-methyltransferase RlmD [Erysipelotrichales bacterium]
MNKLNKQAQVIDYTHDGKGLIKADGKPYFIKNVIVGEEIDYTITKDKKKYGFARVDNIITKSTNRIDPLCPYFNECGGCQLQYMNYDEQISFKEKKIINAFSKQGITLDKLNVIRSNQEFNYRNKITFSLAKENNIISAALFKENTNHLINIKHCLIQNDVINNVMNEVVKLLNKYNIDIYNKTKHQGYLRQVVIRCNEDGSEVLIGFIVNSKKYQGDLDNIIDNLIKQEKIKSVVINLNKEKVGPILGNKTKVVYGTGYIIDSLDDMKFKISLNSFYQVNPIQMKNLYTKAVELASISENDLVLDAYCGVGTISSFVAKKAKEVVGVDIVESAIDDANKNMKLNKINNLDFICSDVDDYMNDKKNKFDVVMIDPPRKGCSNSFLESLVTNNPKRIVYISCDVATQARDIKFLLDNDYKLEYIEGVDMFSQTYHVESVALLKKD